MFNKVLGFVVIIGGVVMLYAGFTGKKFSELIPFGK